MRKDEYKIILLSGVESRGPRIDGWLPCSDILWNQHILDLFDLSPAAIVPKYSFTDKCIGGIVHVAAGGVLMTYEKMHKTKITFPFFTNSEEICPMCNKPPGAPRCRKIGELCNVELLIPNGKNMTIHVNHSSMLDKIKSADSNQSEDIKG